MEIFSTRFASSLDYIRARGYVLDAIADVIVTDCKAHYINSCIKLTIRDLVSRHAFTSALLAFDRDTDKIIAKSILTEHFKKSQELHLDSFYDFMIDVLKERWDEVCLLANDNAQYLMCQKTFTELLQFLISNIDCQMDDTMFMHIADAPVRENVKAMFLKTMAMS